MGSKVGSPNSASMLTNPFFIWTKNCSTRIFCWRWSHCVCYRSTFPYPIGKGHLFYPYPSCTECADRQLLQVKLCKALPATATFDWWLIDLLFDLTAFLEVSVCPKKEFSGVFILFRTGLRSFTALLALLTHHYPESMGYIARTLSLT